MTLVVLAAGLASRYGKLKQIDTLTDTGEFLIDFSVFDARRAGFDKVVFVINKENVTSKISELINNGDYTLPLWR